LTRIGLPEAAKVAVTSKIVGAQIQEYDEEYFYATFGIIDDIERLKVSTEISNSQKR